MLCDWRMPFSTLPAKPTIGFYGGSFDPIHQGHVSLALYAIKQFSLEKILLCPAFLAPLRKEKPAFSAAHRLAMVDSVTKENENLVSFDYEIRAEKTCYTFETLQVVRKKFPQHQIILILGDDQIAQIQKWKFHRQLLEEFNILVFRRSADPSNLDTIPDSMKENIQILENQLFPPSSTQIREHLRLGKDISAHIPPSVFKYMKNNRLLDYLYS